MKKLLLFFLIAFSSFSSYEIEGKTVYYDGKTVINADSATFVIIERDADYGKDKNHVYYAGKEIKGADPRYFDYISYGTTESLYFKDKKKIYFSGKEIKDADFKSFRILGSNYSKDKNNIYYEGEKLSGADVKTFRRSDCNDGDEHGECSLAEDKDNYYEYGKVTRKK